MNFSSTNDLVSLSPAAWGGVIMILGIGIDIIQSERIRGVVGRRGVRFLNRVFTPGEQAYCARKSDGTESLAARFAVKEAAFKALGSGWSAGGGFLMVEVVNAPSGKPEVVFHGRAKEIAERIGVKSALASITHDAGVSAAVVLLEG